MVWEIVNRVYDKKWKDYDIKKMEIQWSFHNLEIYDIEALLVTER